MHKSKYDNHKEAKPLDTRIKDGSIVDENGCWIWKSDGQINKWGYAKFITGSRRDNSRRHKFVHRVSYEVFVGDIPEGLHIDHLCRVNRCVNPDHLEPVTPAENNKRNDKLPPTINAKKKNCPKCGGEWVQLKDRRQCRPCTLGYYKRYNARRRSVCHNGATSCY